MSYNYTFSELTVSNLKIKYECTSLHTVYSHFHFISLTRLLFYTNKEHVKFIHDAFKINCQIPTDSRVTWRMVIKNNLRLLLNNP